MNRMFVGNLSFNVTEGELEAFIRAYGIEVEQVEIIRDAHTGKSRGFGFVQLREGQDLAEAIAALNGRNLQGRDLNVNEARERSRSSGRGGGSAPYGGRAGGRRW